MNGAPRLLDAFCCQGGATRGYQLAGFHVTGVDINPQPRYIGDEFVQGDALEFIRAHGAEFDAIHASPPCQAHTSMRHVNPGRTYADLIPATRSALAATGRPYIIENVPGAKTLRPVVMLCGTMFGLRTPCGAELRRHRYFEANFPVGMIPPCQHGAGVITIVGHCSEDPRFASHGRTRTITVTGATPQQNVVRNTVRRTFSIEYARLAMGIEWMPMSALSQAIPPAYTAFIGAALVEYLRETEAAR